MATLRERLEEARQIIESGEESGFQAIKPERFYAEFQRANRMYAEKVLGDLESKGCFTETAARTVLVNKSEFLTSFDKRFEQDDVLNRKNSLVGDSYNRTYKLLKIFMDKFSLEDQADEQEKRRAMGYRLLTTFLVGIVFMVLAYGADMAGFQFVFLHKKPSCPENYVCIKQEDHDKQQKELDELTKRVAAYAIPASKFINPAPAELKPQANPSKLISSEPKQKD